MSRNPQEIQTTFDVIEDAVGAPVEQPQYLEYLVELGANNPDEARVARLVGQLTVDGVRKEMGAEVAGAYRSPAERARYWYRSLGPLNPMDDALPDLAKAADMTFSFEHRDRKLALGIKLDNAFMLSEIARISDEPAVKVAAVNLGLNQIDRILSSPDLASDKTGLAESYQSNVNMLKADLQHTAARTQFEAEMASADRLKDEKAARLARREAYAKYERSYTAIEVMSIRKLKQLMDDGKITEESVGAAFEWFFIADQRYQVWQEEAIDTTTVRSATSREDAEWRGDAGAETGRAYTPNHDVVIDTAEGTRRIQLKTNNKSRLYDARITVLDMKDVLGARHTMDAYIPRLSKRLGQITHDYRATLG